MMNFFNQQSQPSITYLGIQFYRTLSFVPHIQNILNLDSKPARLRSMLRGRFNGCLTPTLNDIYKTFIRLLIIYSLPIMTPPPHSYQACERAIRENVYTSSTATPQTTSTPSPILKQLPHKLLLFRRFAFKTTRNI